MIDFDHWLTQLDDGEENRNVLLVSDALADDVETQQDIDCQHHVAEQLCDGTVDGKFLGTERNELIREEHRSASDDKGTNDRDERTRPVVADQQLDERDEHWEQHQEGDGTDTDSFQTVSPFPTRRAVRKN